jgi:hypothetical protein
MIVEVLPHMIRLAGEINTADEQNNVTALNGIIAFISATFIIPLIQQPKWATKTRAAVTFFYSLLVGLLTTWVAGDFDLANATTSVITVFTLAIVTYHGFAQPTGIAPTIENATSPATSRKQPLDDPPA